MINHIYVYRKPELPTLPSSSSDTRDIPRTVICRSGWVENAYIPTSSKRLANTFSKISSLIDTAYFKFHSLSLLSKKNRK